MATVKNYGLGNYVDYQQCLGSNSNTDRTYFIGVSSEPVCPATEIEWFKSGVDFDITEIGENAIEGSADDLELAGANYEAIINNKIKEELTLSIKPSFNSRLWQRLSSIQMEDALQRKNGALIKAYLNGGFHLLITTKGKDLNFDKVYTNLISTTLPNDVLQNWSDNELSAELSFQNIHQPYYDLKQLPVGMGTPSDFTTPTITIDRVTVSASDIGLTPTLQDEDEVAINNDILVSAYDKNDQLVGSTKVTSGTKATINGTFNTGDNYKVICGYFVAENLPINSFTFNSKGSKRLDK